MAKVLHVLSQRPSLTGSGITLDALVRHAAFAGWSQQAVVGVPAEETRPVVGGLDGSAVHPLHFETSQLPFPVPGMSDVMPYRSTVFSSMTPDSLEAYRRAWRRHLTAVVSDFGPDVIHCHHLWLVASMLKDVAPRTPVVNHCHATGLRQMALCSQLGPEVRRGCARNDEYAVLHDGHAKELCHELEVDGRRVHVVGAGYNEKLFHASGRSTPASPRLLYVGKLSAAKGLPQLLDATSALLPDHPGLELHVAGSGAGDEADALARRMGHMAEHVIHHGHLDQARLAGLMRRSTVCVLSSFYEGLPLVLVEALACGCRLVATDLPGIRNQLAPHLGSSLRLLALPRLIHIDRPEPADLEDFVNRLATSIADAIRQGAIDDPEGVFPDALAHFTWKSVFQRVEAIWRRIIGSPITGTRGVQS